MPIDSRPRWWRWTVYVLSLLVLMVIGAGFGLLCSWNPYVAGAFVVGGVLRLIWTAKRREGWR